MIYCPYCQSEINLRELPHQGYFQSFRICPKCGGKFTVDTDTKIRQALFVIIALISLGFTMLLYFQGSAWTGAAVASYVALALLLLWGNSRVKLVQYGNEEKGDRRNP